MKDFRRLIVVGDRVTFSEGGYINIGEVHKIETHPDKETVYTVWSLKTSRLIHRRQVKKVIYKPCFKWLEGKSFKSIVVTKEGIRFSGYYGDKTIGIGEFDESLLGGEKMLLAKEVRRAYWDGGWHEDYQHNTDVYNSYRKVFGMYRHMTVWVCNYENSKVEGLTLTIYKRSTKKHDKPSKGSVYSTMKKRLGA